MPPRSRRLRQRQLAKEKEEAEAAAADEGLAAEQAPVDDEVDDASAAPAAESAEAEVDWPEEEADGADSDELAIDLDEAEAPDVDDPSTDAYEDDSAAADGEADEAQAASSRRGRSSRRRRRAGDDDEDEGGAAGRSSRRSGRRSARTSAKKSARKSRKARKPVDPEAAAARKRAIATVLMIVLGFAVVGGGGYAAYMALHEEPQRIEVQLSEGPREFEGTKSDLARKLLEDAKFQYGQLQGAITGNQPNEAEQAQADAIALLNQPVLGNAQMSDPRPEDLETIGSVDLAREAFELRQDIEAKDRAIARVRNRQRAQANLATLVDRFGNISAEVDLDVLEKDARDFIENPVDPESGVALVEDKGLFVKYVERIRNRLDEIVTERGRREKANTTTVATRANNETDRLIAESRYSDALSAIDNLSQQYPDAPLQAVRQKVLKAAEQAWQTARESAKNLYSRATAASTEQGQRAGSLQEAIALLENVTQNFGSAPEVSSYVSEAREMLTKYRQTDLD